MIPRAGYLRTMQVPRALFKRCFVIDAKKKVFCHGLMGTRVQSQAVEESRQSVWVDYILPLFQNTSHFRNFKTDLLEGKMTMFTPICYSYLVVIDSYMHMHFLNRVR